MSCLFNSLTKLLSKELQILNIYNLRLFICRYMEKNLDTMLKNDKLKDWLDAISLDKYGQINIKRYIQEMRSSSTWGGAPEIAVVSKLFACEIVVNYFGKDVAVFNNTDKKCFKRLYLSWTGGHYEPIKSVKL